MGACRRVRTGFSAEVGIGGERDLLDLRNPFGPYLGGDTIRRLDERVFVCCCCCSKTHAARRTGEPLSERCGLKCMGNGRGSGRIVRGGCCEGLLGTSGMYWTESSFGNSSWVIIFGLNPVGTE